MSRLTFGLIATTLIYFVPTIVALGITSFVRWDANFAQWGPDARGATVFIGICLTAGWAMLVEWGFKRNKVLDRLHDEMRGDA